MGRRIDDLKIDDRPHGADGEPIEDERESEWFAFVAEITDLLEGNEYEWAEDTLGGIQSTVQRTRTVSEAQRRAVTNIVAAKTVRRSRWRR